MTLRFEQTELCRRVGYEVDQWKEPLLRMGQTKVFFSTTAALPYRSESELHSLVVDWF